MHTANNALRAIAAVAVLGLTLLLAGCMLSPGRFVSELDLRKDGRFSFHYQGEIHVLALSDFATKDAQGRFSPAPCINDEGETRACTQDEMADQKASWESNRSRRSEKQKREAQMGQAAMGGIDPSDPKAAEELAERLRKQAGFRQVEYKGNGLYLVDFAVASRLTHDFSFPAIERFPMANAFVQIALRQGGMVRIDAPGFARGGTGNPMAAMMGGLGAEAAEGGPKLPALDGRFTLTTDGEIVANNTDEGPLPDAGGKRLSWAINNRTQAAPMALIDLAR